MAAIRTLAEIPTLTSLYASKTLRAVAEPVVTKPSATLNNIISHIRYDITKLEVDCIVNAANSRLAGGGGVDGAIHAAAGPELLEECRSLDGCPTGQAKITNAYRLPCKKVIHAVGPVYHREQDPEKLLRSCYRNSLQLAVQHGLKSIAFSAISTGVYGYPSDEAADAAIDEVREFLLRDHNASLLERVIFCSFMPKDVKAYEETLPVYFPPVEDSSTAQTDEQTTDKNDADVVIIDQSDASRFKSEDDNDWEEVHVPRNEREAGGEWEEEPVEVDRQPDQSSSVADIQSMQSSSADFQELSASEARR
ncbi:hypothetical protein VTN31DRAFT_5702 [Thermomyces dupontii]|uniref:uncharacterized protein n=1 Tax=Talaromyces thermophilus TaxID=28565 RepID=UPI003742810A